MDSRLTALTVTGTLTAATLAFMPVLFPLTGAPGSNFVAGLGRFHILVLHFPIALLLVVPLLELLGRLQPLHHLKRSAHSILALAALFAALACVLGYMLATGEGDAGELLDEHMWGGITTAILSVFALILREAWRKMQAKPLRVAYWIVLLAGIVSLTIGSHHGASLVHGENYLTEKFAAALEQSITGESEAYGAFIKPIFEANCYACHSGSKDKGGFRVDDFARLLEGGDSGMAGIEPNDLEASEVHYRITLDPKAKAFMPPDGRRPLSTEEVARIAWWIGAGASPTASIAELLEKNPSVAVSKKIQP